MTYLYSVTWCGDVNEEEEHSKGFVSGESFVNAVEELIDHFGEGEVISVEVEEFSSNNIVEFWDKDFEVFDQAKRRAGENVIW